MMRPEEYATKYRQFVTQFPNYKEPFLVATGPRGHSADGDIGWTTGFFEGMRGFELPNGFSIHFYTDLRQTPLKAADFNQPEWYEVMLRGVRIDKVIESHWQEMGKVDTKRRTKLIVDEWGVWYKPGELHFEPAHHTPRCRAHRPDLRHLQSTRRQNRDGQRRPNHQLHSLSVPGAWTAIRAHASVLRLRDVSFAHGSATSAGGQSCGGTECTGTRRRGKIAGTFCVGFNS
jgi:hypothetical protein